MIITSTTTDQNVSRRTYDTDLRGLLKLLYDYKLSILLCTLIGLLAALAYLAYAPPTYTASGTIIIDPRFRKIVGEEVVQGGIGLDQKLVQSQVAIIKSPAMLRRVVKKLNLQDKKEFSKPPGWFAKTILRRPMVKDPVARAVADLADRIKVKRPLKTYLVDIQASSRSAQMSVRIVKTLIETYLSSLVEAETKETQQAHNVIAGRLAELRKRVREDEARIDQYRKSNKIVSALGGLVSERQLAQHSTNLAATRTALATAKARLEESRAALAAGGSPESLSESVNSRLIQSLREQYSRVSQRVASLSSQMLPGHPVLKDARSQQQQIRTQIAAELKRIAASAQSDYNIAAKREKKLSELLAKAKREVSLSNTAQIKLRALEQEASTSRKLLREFLARAKETQEQARLSYTTARVISPPTAPFKPSWPVPLIVLGLGAIGGLGIGAIRALLRDHTMRDRRDSQLRAGISVDAEPSGEPRGTSPRAHPIQSALLTPRNARPATQLETVSTIPDFTAADPVRNTDQTKNQQETCCESTDLSYVVGVLSRPQTSAHRAYIKSIKAFYERLAGSKDHARMLLLASPLSGHGVSSIALSLTFLAIRDRKKVLLIDAAAHSSSLSEAFGGRQDGAQRRPLAGVEDLRAAMYDDDEIGRWFLSLAPYDLQSMSSKQTMQLTQSIQKLAGDYELVIIDAGSVKDDDAPGLLGGLADRVYLVNRSGVLRDEMIRTARRAIAPDGARFGGLVEVRFKA